jgi:prepilin peptidase CpaA
MRMEIQAMFLMAPLIAMLACAAILDLRSRRIPNWLTFSMIASGLCQAWTNPWITAHEAMLGMLTGFGLTFVLFALGALGGGDVKLLAGVGAWIGVKPVFLVFAVAAIVGMIMVLCQSLAQGRLRLLLRNSAVVAINVFHIGVVGVDHATETGKSCRSVDRPLPYAVPVLAAVLVLVVGRVLWNA